jgi:hypothetical protein
MEMRLKNMGGGFGAALNEPAVVGIDCLADSQDWH